MVLSSNYSVHKCGSRNRILPAGHVGLPRVLMTKDISTFDIVLRSFHYENIESDMSSCLHYCIFAMTEQLWDMVLCVKTNKFDSSHNLVLLFTTLEYRIIIIFKVVNQEYFNLESLIFLRKGIYFYCLLSVPVLFPFWFRVTIMLGVVSDIIPFRKHQIFRYFISYLSSRKDRLMSQSIFTK